MFNTLSIRAITQETPDAVAISFDVPSGMEDAYRFAAVSTCSSI